VSARLVLLSSDNGPSEVCRVLPDTPEGRAEARAWLSSSRLHWRDFGGPEEDGWQPVAIATESPDMDDVSAERSVLREVRSS
jgi:hypothetical protein